MAMERFDCSLPVPVGFDEATGGWQVDGLPVLLVPRHFWIYMQRAMEDGVGLGRARALIRAASYKGALTWCAHQQRASGLKGADLFRRYMESGSRRGYGLMNPELIDLEGGRARIRVDHSVYVTEIGRSAGRNVCYMFEGAFSGGLAASSETLGYKGDWAGEETLCGANGAPGCLFEIRRIEGN